MAGWWEREIVEPGKLPLLLCLLAFVATFLLTRTITRLIRAGRGPFHDVVKGGVHIHHSIPGIVLWFVGAIMAIGPAASAPWREIAAITIGIGASLVLDEFALILHLDDVYWSDEGEASVQAVALVVACLGCLLVGLSPFGVDDVDRSEAGIRSAGLVLVGAAIAAAAVCVMKGKYRLVLIAAFFPPVAIAGAVRLARPNSAWDRHRYAHRPRARARATARATSFDAFWDPRFRLLGDVIAGRPSSPDPPATAPSGVTTRG